MFAHARFCHFWGKMSRRGRAGRERPWRERLGVEALEDRRLMDAEMPCRQLVPVAVARLAQVISVDPPGGAVVQGQTVTYTLDFTLTDCVGVAQVQADFPAELACQLTDISWTASGTHDAVSEQGSGIGDIDDLVNMPVSSSITYAVTATVHPQARGTITVRSAVMHELGHVFDYGHEDDGLMAEMLSPGMRWTIDTDAVHGAFASLW